MKRGAPGELPPSDDEYEEEDEPKMDKFGNYIVDDDDGREKGRDKEGGGEGEEG